MRWVGLDCWYDCCGLRCPCEGAFAFLVWLWNVGVGLDSWIRLLSLPRCVEGYFSVLRVSYIAWGRD
jgi:hypothetical protein